MIKFERERQQTIPESAVKIAKPALSPELAEAVNRANSRGLVV